MKAQVKKIWKFLFIMFAMLIVALIVIGSLCADVPAFKTVIDNILHYVVIVGMILVLIWGIPELCKSAKEAFGDILKK